MTTEAKGLIEKLVAVMAVVERIPKTGYNEHFKYFFARESDVKDALRAALVAERVLLLSSIVDVEHNGSVTTIKTSHTFADADSDQRETVLWSSQGQDTQDKGVSKAATSALKYMLLDNFLVATGDDPDAAGPLKEKRQPQPRPNAFQGPQDAADVVFVPYGKQTPATATPATWKWFHAKLNDMALTHENVLALLKVKSIKDDMAIHPFEVILAWIEKAQLEQKRAGA